VTRPAPPAALVPHAGSMCLLDEVLTWDDTRVACRSASHLRADNPLCRGGAVSAIHLLEYGAQASAVHGGLLSRAGDAPPPMYMAAVRDVEFHVTNLEDIPTDLYVDAELLLRMGESVLYRFRVLAGDAEGRLLAAGRLTFVPPRIATQ
jgi:predicted hotdog family 3-hydroxylacyl-ACP dehydratase